MTVSTLLQHETLGKPDHFGTYAPYSAAELAYWQDLAAMLDPAAFVLLESGTLGPVPASKRWYALNYWQVISGINRTDTGCTMVSGSPTLTDPSITAADSGLFVAGPGISSGRQLLAAVSGSATMAANPTFPATPAAAAGAAGVLTGAYKYQLTFTGPFGESLPGAQSSTVNPSSQQVNLTGLSAGPSGTTARTLYRTQAGGSTFTRVAVINDNTTTTYTDNATDASIVGNAAPPTSISVQVFAYKFLRDWGRQTAMAMPTGASLVIAPSGGFIYACKPDLVIPAPYGTGTDQRYITDPKALYYNRLQTLQSLTPYDLDAVVPPSSSRGTNSLATFPTDFTFGLVTAAYVQDAAWVGLRTPTGGAVNLMNELNDDHQLRMASALMVPFDRTVFSQIKMAGASVIGDAQTPTGGGYGAGTNPFTGLAGLTYYKLPVGW